MTSTLFVVDRVPDVNICWIGHLSARRVQVQDIGWRPSRVKMTGQPDTD